MRLAVIGLGTMGFSTARNLLARGHVVVGCDLRADARTALTELGGTSVAHAADLPADTEAVIVFVVNAAQVEDCLFGSHGCAKIFPPGTLLVICTTTHPSASREIAARCDRANTFASTLAIAEKASDMIKADKREQRNAA